MQKNMLPVLVTSLILPCSLLTMDKSSTNTSSTDSQEPMVVRAQLVSNSASSDNQQASYDLSASELVAAIDRLTPDKVDRVFDKLSQKLSQSDSDSAPDKKPSSAPLSKEKRKPLELPRSEQGMPTLIDSALSKVVSNTTMTLRLLQNATYSPKNATHAETLKGALNEIVAQDDKESFFKIIALLQSNEHCKKHNDLIPNDLAKTTFDWLKEHHIAYMKKSNQTIEDEKTANYTHFNTATAVFIKAIDQTITEYIETIQSKCGQLDTVVADQQKKLDEKRNKLESIKILNSSIHGDLKILTDKQLKPIELNPGLTQFEQHKHRLNSMKRNSAIPTLDMPANQQLALTDK